MKKLVFRHWWRCATISFGYLFLKRSYDSGMAVQFSTSLIQLFKTESAWYLFRFICDGCDAYIVETYFHCTVCFNFQLCIGCYKSGKYPAWYVVFTLSSFLKSLHINWNYSEKCAQWKINDILILTFQHSETSKNIVWINSQSAFSDHPFQWFGFQKSNFSSHFGR